MAKVTAERSRSASKAAAAGGGGLVRAARPGARSISPTMAGGGSYAPHALGWKNDRAMLLAYQIGGHTTTTGTLPVDPPQTLAQPLRRRHRLCHRPPHRS